MRKIIPFVIIASLIILSACSSSQIDGQVTNTPTQSAPINEEVRTGGCPRGISDDPFPGLCPIYTDKNDNNLCDLGE